MSSFDDDVLMMRIIMRVKMMTMTMTTMMTMMRMKTLDMISASEKLSHSSKETEPSPF